MVFYFVLYILKDYFNPIYYFFGTMTFNIYIWYQIPKILNKRGELICEESFRKIGRLLFLISIYAIFAIVFLFTYPFFLDGLGGNTQSVLFLCFSGIQLMMYLKIYAHFRKAGQIFGIFGYFKKFMYHKQRKKLFQIIQGSLFFMLLLFITAFYVHHHNEIYREGLLFKYDRTNYRSALYTRFVFSKGNKEIKENETFDYIPWSSNKNGVKRLQNGIPYEESENALTYIVQDSNQEGNDIVESYYFNAQGKLYKVIAQKNLPMTDLKNVDLSFLDFSSYYLDRCHANLEGDGRFIIIEKQREQGNQNIYDDYKIIENQLYNREDYLNEKGVPQISTAMYYNIIKKLQNGHMEIVSIKDCNATTVVSEIKNESLVQSTGSSSTMVLKLIMTNSKLQ